MRKLSKRSLALVLFALFVAIFFIDNVPVKAYELNGTYEEYGSSYSFVCPHTDFYTIEVDGSCGGSGTNTGGRGGRVTVVSYIQKGQTLTFQIGSIGDSTAGNASDKARQGGGLQA